MKKQFRREKINNEIKIPKIRLVGEGFNGIIVSLHEALLKAQELELDLVLLSEKDSIGICKIVNYEKLQYELSKKPKPKTLDMKEIKIGPNTSDNDLNYRREHMIEFLKKGHLVRITLQFRGREMAFIDKGRESMLKLVVSLSEYGTPDALPDMEGKKMFTTLKPKSNK